MFHSVSHTHCCTLPFLSSTLREVGPVEIKAIHKKHPSAVAGNNLPSPIQGILNWAARQKHKSCFPYCCASFARKLRQTLKYPFCCDIEHQNSFSLLLCESICMKLHLEQKLVSSTIEMRVGHHFATLAMPVNYIILLQNTISDWESFSYMTNKQEQETNLLTWFEVQANIQCINLWH